MNLLDIKSSDIISDSAYYVNVSKKIDDEKDDEKRAKTASNAKKIALGNINILNDLYKKDTFNNRFESTNIPCYKKIPGTYLSFPTGTFRYNYNISNNDIGGNNRMKNLLMNTKVDNNMGGIYFYEKEYELYGEKIIQNGNQYEIGTQNFGTNDSSNFNKRATALRGGGTFNPKWRVLKNDAKMTWRVYCKNDGGKWKEQWIDNSRYIKIEYHDLKQNKRLAWIEFNNLANIAENIKSNEMINSLFNRSPGALSCKYASLPVVSYYRGDPKCETKPISQADYDYIKGHHPKLFNECNREGFINSMLHNEKVNNKYKKQLGNIYILMSGLVLMYLLLKLSTKK